MPKTAVGGEIMDNFKAVYRIFSELEKALDYERCDISRFDHEQLGVSYMRWVRYIEMMQNAGYIDGAQISVNIHGDYLFDGEDMQITLKGLEYLQENSIMRKTYKIIKGIKDITPGA